MPSLHRVPLVLALVLCACTTSDDDDGSTDPTDTPQPNTVPPAPEPRIEPADPVTGSALEVVWDDVVDPDGDDVTYRVLWEVDERAGSFRPRVREIPGDVVVRGQTWSVQVVARDGRGESEPGTTSITIANIPPVIDTFSFEPAAPRTDDTITASATASDADGDTLVREWVWTVDGTEVARGRGVSSLRGTEFDKGDEVVGTVSFDDGHGGVVSETTGPILVGNSAPGAPRVALVPAAPGADEDVRCELVEDAPDPDDDAITYTFSWEVDGRASTATSTTTRPGDTLSSSATEAGQTVVCLAEPHDGTSTGITGWARASVAPDAPPVAGLVTGANLTCGLLDDNSLNCWGIDTSGQARPPEGVYRTASLGTVHGCGVQTDDGIVCWGGTVAGQSTQPPEGRFVQLDSGGNHNCAIAVNGSLDCWGSNQSGESDPPDADETWIDVAVGLTHSCALRESDGVAECWGANNQGQRTAPTDVFVDLAAGGDHTCGRTPAGDVVCWGANLAGQGTPPVGVGPLNGLTAGLAHTCALDGDDHVICWGDDTFGQTAAPGGTFLSVRAGDTHTCGLDTSGAVVCWGDGTAGALFAPIGIVSDVSLGTGYTCTLDGFGYPSCWGADLEGETLPTFGRYSKIEAGTIHTCALDSAGDITCWGSPTAGRLTAPAGPWNDLSAGGEHTCGVATSGTVDCWGGNTFGQRGQVPTMGTFDAVCAGETHVCALASTGDVDCWGSNLFGEGSDRTGPFTDLECGGTHNCAIDELGGAVCWGGLPLFPALTQNQDGPFVQVSSDDWHNCGRADDGTVTCWGVPVAGDLTPPEGVDFDHVAVGTDATTALSVACGIDFDSKLWCWGAEWRQPID